jgi:23S rRNA (uracil1939-C5)-methyltransferase
MTCRHLGTCGGCTSAAPYPTQLEDKRRRLESLLGLSVPPLVASPRTEGFRQKAAFTFAPGAKGRGLVMGHYAARSRQLVPITECPVHSPRANRIAFALLSRFKRFDIKALGVEDGLLRHLIVRTTDDDREAVAMLVVTENHKSLRTPIKGFLASPDAPDGFFININDRVGPTMVGDRTIKIAGRAQVRQRDVVGLDFLVSPDAFFQTNVDGARALVEIVLAAVPATGRVLDLYCGSGLFTLPLAQRGAHVTAVEENRSAIEDLEANVRLNRLDASRIRAITGRVEALTERLLRTPWDAVVLDPPREGCAPGVLSTVFDDLRPPRAVYVSCDPDVLARDLKTIVALGYRVATVQAVDMFPHTSHIETVVVLERGVIDRAASPAIA